jgi:predicted esterase
MNSQEKTVTYTTKNSYSTLNTLSDTTENFWIVLHGIGHLSRYFLRHFEGLPADKNYILAPQAPSKYYLSKAYTHVGASWLTQEDTHQEITNVLAYLDAVRDAENIPENCHLIILGFSQGVSIATRWAAQRQIQCDQLVLYAGGIPNELQPADFDFLLKNDTKVSVILGDQDEYLTGDRRTTESQKIEKLFGGKAKEIVFKGGHEMKKEIINDLLP